MAGWLLGALAAGPSWGRGLGKLYREERRDCDEAAAEETTRYLLATDKEEQWQGRGPGEL
jgi:hypothetical protein